MKKEDFSEYLGNCKKLTHVFFKEIGDKMIKKIIFTSILFIIISTVMTTYYWYNKQYEPSIFQLWLHFLILPILFTIFLFILPKTIKKIKQHNTEKMKMDEVKAIETKEPEQTLNRIQMNIYSSHILTAMGNNADIFNYYEDSPDAKLDLFFQKDGHAPISAYRINNNERFEMDVDQRLERIKLLIDDQIYKNKSKLDCITKHIRKSQHFYDENPTYQYKIHPNWIDPNRMVSDENEQDIEEIKRLDALNIDLIFSKSMKVEWTEGEQQNFISKFCENSGIDLNKINFNFHFWNLQNSYANWMGLLENISKKNNEISYIIIVDSEIDLKLVENLRSNNMKYIPAEFVASCIVGATNIQVEGLDILKKLSMISDEISLNECLDKLKLDQLEQYKKEKPFVAIVDEISTHKNRDDIAQYFAQTAISTQHYFYSAQMLGSTQSLLHIHGFMLGLHFPEVEMSMVVSTEQSEFKVFIT